ncbi:hypothetical protein chiPu_0027321 [Chiloscyllium punctatum]|uniref:Uncharacterized protein n=1 Tax=Chiloscyllium punctatum TaxID=137246 RepID=A0A401TLQ4_CHIPU|nr:hypothetical protein [Chiloscyllium punctatum]
MTDPPPHSLPGQWGEPCTARSHWRWVVGGVVTYRGWVHRAALNVAAVDDGDCDGHHQGDEAVQEQGDGDGADNPLLPREVGGGVGGRETHTHINNILLTQPLAPTLRPISDGSPPPSLTWTLCKNAKSRSLATREGGTVGVGLVVLIGYEEPTGSWGGVGWGLAHWGFVRPIAESHFPVPGTASTNRRRLAYNPADVVGDGRKTATEDIPPGVYLSLSLSRNDLTPPAKRFH